MRRPLHALATLSFTLLAHCGSDPVPAPATDVPATRDTSAADAPDVVVVDAADASTDAPALDVTADVATDAARDATTLEAAADVVLVDAAMDVGIDVAPDVAMDAPTDVSTDTGADASSDGGDAACIPTVLADPYASQRAACHFTAGARVRDTLGLDDRTRAALPIRTVVVVMKENRSYDQLLGRLHDRGQPASEAMPAGFTNPDARGVAVPFTHAATTCSSYDPGHQWDDMHAQVDNGLMDGFVAAAARSAGGDGHLAMTYFDQDDLPFYYWLASTFAVNDRHFASLRSGTFPNRNFMLLGTADGVRSTGGGYPAATTPSIFDRLDAAGVAWGAYSDGSYFSGSFAWTTAHRGTHSFADLLRGLDAGTLPPVVFVDGIDNVEDEHPDGNVQQGEAWTRTLYDHAVRSPLWPGLAMIWTYDEAGGFADHVPPPNAACVARPGPTDAAYVELGARVPFVVVSPWARAHSVSHTVQEHTAVTRFIEAVFDLPALTARDANSPALLDLFDFSCGPSLLHPPMAPAAGTHGCFGGCRVSLDRATYRPGDAIRASFAGCPGNDPIDWIGVYPDVAASPGLPHPGSTLWQYVGGSHAGTTMPTSGTITLDASALGRGPWPLPAGSYTAYYLLHDQYRVVDAVDFTVAP